jgi:hypothetical protein
MKSKNFNKYMIIAILLVFLYITIISLLCYFGILSKENLVLTFTTALGWLVALLIAIIHLNRIRIDNQTIKKYDIKKKLEIEAFKEVNKAINEFSNRVTSVLTHFSYTLPSKLKFHIQNPFLFKFDPIQVDQELGLIRVNLYQGNANFLLSIEAHEIAIIEYDHYRKYINFKTEDLSNLINEFIKYFTIIKKKDLIKEQGFLEFNEKCHQINELAHEIISYLFDYRILLMNSILEEIFDKTVPSRKPKEPKYKLLTELAFKEEVKKEEERRVEAAIKK